MPKPWADKDSTPYQGGNDNDGLPVGGEPFEKGPGDGEFRTPNESPFADDKAKRRPGGTV
jgi:hypothetical protein